MRYLLEGAAARSEATTKVKLIDAALLKARISTGDEPLEPPPTKGYQRTLSGIQREAAAAASRALQQQVLDQLKADEVMQTTLQAQIRRLEEAKTSAEDHRQLVSVKLLLSHCLKTPFIINLNLPWIIIYRG